MFSPKKGFKKNLIIILISLILIPFTGIIDNIQSNEENISQDEKIIEFNNLNSASSGSEYMNFNYFKIVKVNMSEISGSQPLADYPLLLSIFDEDLRFDVQTNGNDIAFAIDNIWLDHEIEEFDQDFNSTHAKLVAWIRIPFLKPYVDNEIYMYYGNGTMNSRENPTGVWQNYMGVWHLNESSGSGSYLLDSTSNNHDGTPYGTQYADSGKIEGARTFLRSGTNEIGIASGDSILDGSSQFSFSFWIYPNYTSDSDWEQNSDQQIFFKGGSVRLARLFRFNGFPAGKGNFQTDIGFQNYGTVYFNSLVSRQQWNHLTVSYNGNYLRMFINGEMTSSVFIGDDNLNIDDSLFSIGTGANTFFGIIDEFRVSETVTPSIDWAVTEYNNHNDPSSFIIIGEEQISSESPPNTEYFNQNKIITINNSKVIGTGDHYDFPLLLSIYDSDLHEDVQSNGNDIAFALGNIWLDHEIESFNRNYNDTHAELVAWIRVPALSCSVDTNITMFYGNNTMNSQENQKGVWNGNYQGVWHMNELDPLDSTYNNYNGIAHTSMTGSNIQNSQIGNGLDFDGTNDYVDMDDVLRPESELSMSAWVKPDVLSSSSERFVIDRSNTGTGIDYGMALETDDIRFVFYDSGMDGHGSDTNVEIGVWQYFVITKVAGGYLRYYDDGFEVDSTTSGILADNGSTNFILGARYTGTSDFFNGLMDEVRISNKIRSAEWIQTEYNNQFNPEGFVTVGIENSFFIEFSILSIDHDGNPVPDLNITLLNQTNPLVWDNPGTNSQISDGAGTTTFDRIERGNYTIKAIYGEKYNNPLLIKEVNVSVLEDSEFILDNLNLTKMELTLVYEGTVEPFYNAKVSFYEDNGTNFPKYIGYEISDENGKILFTWLNYSAGFINYTLNVEKLGQLWPLNSSEDLNMTVQMENYSEYLIEISLLQADTYSTYLDLRENTKILMNNYYWGEDIPINISYGYEEYPDENTTIRTPISEANVTFNIFLDDIIVANGVFDDNGTGGYDVRLDTDDLNLLASGNSYIMEINAFKPGYDVMSRSIIIELKNIPMDLTPEDSIYDFQFHWLENLSFFLRLNDTYNGDLIDDANVSFYEKDSGLIYGNLQRDSNKGAGWYNFTINSSDLQSVGSYTVKISAEKSNYETLDIEISLEILQISMDIILDNGEDSFEFFWLESLTIEFQLWDLFYLSWINQASITFEEQRNGYISGDAQRNDLKGDGWYNFSINSEDLPKYGTYTIIISAIKDNHLEKSTEIYIDILQINTLINGTIFLPVSYEMEVTTEHEFYFNYTNIENVSILGAENILWELQNLHIRSEIITGVLTNTSSPGLYKMIGLNTSNLKVGTYSLITRISKDNYIERQSAISLLVKRIPIELDKEISDTIYSESKGNSIDISFKILDSISDTPINDANVTISYRGGIYNLEFNESSSEFYYMIDTNEFDVLAIAETFVAIIRIEINENYTLSEISITIQIQPPLGPLGIPLIYWIIGLIVGSLSLGTFVTAKIIAYSRIPLIVKQINTTSKRIKKRKNFHVIKICEDRNELINHFINEDLRPFNLSRSTKTGDNLDDKKK